MTDGNIYTHCEAYGASRLFWANRVDSAGSRVEWRIDTDSDGWVSRYGAVYNEGVLSGSKAIGNSTEEKMLLNELRNLVQRSSTQQAKNAAA